MTKTGELPTSWCHGVLDKVKLGHTMSTYPRPLLRLTVNSLDIPYYLHSIDHDGIHHMNCREMPNLSLVELQAGQTGFKPAGRPVTEFFPRKDGDDVKNQLIVLQLGTRGHGRKSR